MPQRHGQACYSSLFGWNILDLNFTTGALLGYSSENSRVSLKVPAVGALIRTSREVAYS